MPWLASNLPLHKGTHSAHPSYLVLQPFPGGNSADLHSSPYEVPLSRQLFK